MNLLQQPWLELAVVLPLVGAVLLTRFPQGEASRRMSIAIASGVLVLTIAGWLSFEFGVSDPLADGIKVQGVAVLAVDQLNAPLLPLAALLFLLVPIATLRTKVRRFSFALTLVSESLVLATLGCQHTWTLIALLALGTIPPALELRARGKPLRAYVLHMGLFVVLMVIGQTLVMREGLQKVHSLQAMLPLVVAVFIRSGIVPFHCWMTDLFEHATFGTALLFVTPMIGAFAAVRLILPIAPDGILRVLGLIALFTAVYAAGMALVQREARRFFCYILLSHSALVFVGLESVSSICLTGALCLWLSLGLSLAGFGLTLRALEARHGRLWLTGYQGAYENTPMLAICFLLTGMASVGFPGTLGFLGTELLVDGAVQTYPYVGMFVVVAAALNGIAVMKAYFLLFTGKRQEASVTLAVSGREVFAVVTLIVLIIGGGIYPQPNVESRHIAAEELLEKREAAALSSPHTLERVLTLSTSP